MKINIQMFREGNLRVSFARLELVSINSIPVLIREMDVPSLKIDKIVMEVDLEREATCEEVKAPLRVSPTT